jgi:hypothetical protein
MIPTSTIITDYAPNSINYIWDSISGFLYTANAKDFIVVFIILIGVVCLVVAAIKSVFPTFGRKRL